MPTNSFTTLGGYPLYLAFPDGDPGDTIGESFTPGQGQSPVATVQLQCDWNVRYTIWGLMLGTSTGGPGGIIRNYPMQYWDSPNLYCTAITNAKPIQYIGGFKFSKCRFTATFSRPVFDQSFSTISVKVSSQVMQVPVGTFKWTGGVDSGKTVPEAQLGLIVPNTEITITRHMMPYLPIREAELYGGTVNSVPVTIGNATYANGELLFGGMSGEISADVAGNRTYKCEYSILAVKGHTWNQLLDRQLTWQNVNSAVDGSGNAPFASTDFWNLMP
jgi:hypothetical protein